MKYSKPHQHHRKRKGLRPEHKGLGPKPVALCPKRKGLRPEHKGLDPKQVALHRKHEGLRTS